MKRPWVRRKMLERIRIKEEILQEEKRKEGNKAKDHAEGETCGDIISRATLVTGRETKLTTGGKHGRKQGGREGG